MMYNMSMLHLNSTSGKVKRLKHCFNLVSTPTYTDRLMNARGDSSNIPHPHCKEYKNENRIRPINMYVSFSPHQDLVLLPGSLHFFTPEANLSIQSGLGLCLASFCGPKFLFQTSCVCFSGLFCGINIMKSSKHCLTKTH